MFTGSQNLSYNSKSNVLTWLSLAFQAGVINVGGFMACHRFVTHTTGFATFFGAEMAHGNYLTALGMWSVPGFFLLGAMISAFLVDRRIGHGERPLYPVCFGLMASFLILITVLGSFGHFGEFGGDLTISDYYLLLALLCITSGIQNATLTTAFHSVIRTTHLTGLTTDLGIGLVRVLTNSFPRISERDEIRANWARFGIISSFVLGSLFGAWIFIRQRYLGFLVPTLITLVLFVFSLHRFVTSVKDQHKTSHRAVPKEEKSS